MNVISAKQAPIVYNITSEDKVTALESTIDDGTMNFYTTKGGYYILAESKEDSKQDSKDAAKSVITPRTGDEYNVALLTFIMLSSVVLTYVVYYRACKNCKRVS